MSAAGLFVLLLTSLLLCPDAHAQGRFGALEASEIARRSLAAERDALSPRAAAETTFAAAEEPSPLTEQAQREHRRRRAMRITVSAVVVAAVAAIAIAAALPERAPRPRSPPPPPEQEDSAGSSSGYCSCLAREADGGFALSVH